MAISLRTAGSWVAATATTQTVTLPTHATGDMLIVRVGFKHATMPTTVTCGTTGWAKVATEVNGTGGASSNGGGGVEVCAFWKEAASAAETNPVVTFNGGAVAATPSAAVAMAYQKGAGESWLTPVGDGAAVAAATSISATIASHVSATNGDLIDEFHVTNDNTTLTVPTFTQAGLTLDAVTEAPAAALSSTTSNDIAADGCYRSATAGTSSAAAVITGTNSVADLGAAWTTRLRVTGNVTVTPGVASLTLTTFAPVVSRSAYEKAVLADSPVVYYRLGEASGTVAVNEMGTGNADYIGTPTLAVAGALAGDPNTAVTFNGTSQYVNETTNPGVPTGAAARTVEAWVKTTSTLSNAGIVSYGTAAAGQTFSMISAVGVLKLDIEGTVYTFGGVINDDLWHHVVISYDGTNARGYVDGAQVGTTQAVTPSTVWAALRAGLWSNYLAGSIDEVAVYSTALSLTRIQAHYDAGIGSTGTTVTPGVASLVLTTFAPTVSTPQTVTPGVAALTLTTFAPNVTLGFIVVPTTASLSLAAFAPTVSISDNQTVTPGVTALSLATFAPTVTASDHQTVTPTTAALTLATFAPTVTAGSGIIVTPDVAALTLATFAPTITVSDHQLVTPGVVALTLTAFAPNAVVGNVVVPTTAALSLTTFAPTVTASDHQTVTPGVAALSLTAFAPDVVLTDHKLVTPGVVALVLTTFAPTVTAASGLVVVPTPAALTLTAFNPTVVLSDHKIVVPTTAALVLTTFAPTVTGVQTLITGRTRASDGTLLPTCVVHVFRTSDDVEVAETTSGADARYSVPVLAGVAHYLVAYKVGAPDRAGTTVNTLMGVTT